MKGILFIVVLILNLLLVLSVSDSDADLLFLKTLYCAVDLFADDPSSAKGPINCVTDAIKEVVTNAVNGEGEKEVHKSVIVMPDQCDKVHLKTYDYAEVCTTNNQHLYAQVEWFGLHGCYKYSNSTVGASGECCGFGGSNDSKYHMDYITVCSNKRPDKTYYDYDTLIKIGAMEGEFNESYRPLELEVNAICGANVDDIVTKDGQLDKSQKNIACLSAIHTVQWYIQKNKPKMNVDLHHSRNFEECAIEDERRVRLEYLQGKHPCPYNS